MMRNNIYIAVLLLFIVIIVNLIQNSFFCLNLSPSVYVNRNFSLLLWRENACRSDKVGKVAVNWWKIDGKGKRKIGRK